MNGHPMIEKVLSTSQKVSAEARRLAQRYGYLPYMVERYIDMLGLQGAERLLEANERPLPQYLRCNDYLIDCELLVKRLEEKGFELEYTPQFSPYAYKIVNAPIRPGATHEYLQGYYYLQGPASMAIVHSLDPKQGELIIDMAAAPGGKATQILQITRDRSTLIAVEKNRRRMRALRANMQRMRFENYILVRADSTSLNLPASFDRVLLDAPSTGEGTIRKDPSRKTSRRPEDLLYIHKLQVKLLEKAVEIAKPGSTIVYAACTLAPEEGEMVIDYILDKIGGLEVEDHGTIASPALGEFFGIKFKEEVKRCGRFWPHIHDSEGFFLCRLRKLRD